MKKVLILAAAAILWSGAAFAATTPPVWVGGLLVTGLVGADCGNSQFTNYTVNEMYTAVFHPKLSGDSSVTTDVLQISQGGQKAYHYIPSGSVHFAAGAGNYSATTWTGRATIKTFTGTFSNLAITPATIHANTKFVEITGTFNKVDALNCSVTFAMPLTLKAP